MVTGKYAHIWDCCCDHGLLGANLLTSHNESTLHFVDIVPELMQTLESKLQRFYPTAHWQTHCIDVARLPIEQYPGNHLIIIAGVGGDLMIEFIKAIIKKNNQQTLHFLLCPVHHQFALRQTLINLKMSLLDEALVEDNKRFYEVLLVSSSAEHGSINAVGDAIWQANSAEQAEVASNYLTKTLNHYQRIEQGKADNVKKIVEAYRAVKVNQNT